MKINKLTVKNYRTLENVSVEFAGYYAAITGKNNAGKTSLIKALRHTFKDNISEYVNYYDESGVVYQEEKTQWLNGNEDIIFEYDVVVERESDPGLFKFIEKFYEKDIAADEALLLIRLSYNQNSELACVVFVDGHELKSFESNEILQKLKSSNAAFIHDSAGRGNHLYGFRGKYFHELSFSPDERKQIAEEQRKLKNKIKNVSKTHKSELSELLGHLEDKYDVEFTLPEGMFTRTLPCGINLRDKNVDIPLNDWGSGTRNRTQIMMSILQANRIKVKADENRTTPIVIIEEPESFLHPSAQAEFGRVLRDLSRQLKIQTIVTTHSPYMLCQENVSSNILLNRKVVRGKLKETEVVKIDEDKWMEPFSEILGLDNSEFHAWRDVLASEKTAVLLVEGVLDKEYFEFLSSLGFDALALPKGIDIVPYEGKDALKNTILLKFIIEKFKKVFITFDLDAKQEVEKSLTQLGLIEGEDYLTIGVDRSGQQSIEGLIPERIVSKVFGDNAPLVMQLSSQDSKERKSAKSNLKKKILQEFKADKKLQPDELKGFVQVFRAITKRLKQD